MKKSQPQLKVAPTKTTAATRQPLVSIYQDKATHNLQAHIDLGLFDAVKEVAKSHDLNMKKVIEWGFKEFLAHTSPEHTERLGIVVNA